MTVPARSIVSMPVQRCVNSNRSLRMMTGCVTWTNRCGTGAGAGWAAKKSSAMIPDSRRKASEASSAVCAALASPCWPHSTSSAFFALAGSPNPP